MTVTRKIRVFFLIRIYNINLTTKFRQYKFEEKRLILMYVSTHACRTMGSFLVNDLQTPPFKKVVSILWSLMVILWWVMRWEEWKTKKYNFPIFRFWDIVDLKCEKCVQIFFFVRFRCNFFRYDSDDFRKNNVKLKKKKFDEKNRDFLLKCRWARTCSH